MFSDLPITKKLVWIMHLATLSAVLFASLLFGASEALNYRSALVQQIATLGDVIGTNSTAAITFEDYNVADQVLHSLDANKAILSADIYLATGEVFATYRSESMVNSPELQGHTEILALVEEVMSSKVPQERFDGLRYLDAVRPIFFDTELIGFLHMRASLGALVATLQRIAIVATAVMFLAVLVAYILSFRLQSAVSSPITRLSNLMKQVSDGQDYSLRAEPTSGDEIGALMVGFNDMLSQINLRDEKIALANKKLMQSFDETLKAKEAAESASSAKSDFLARMSHEIRTPMNGVLGMTELLMSSDLKDSERNFAETIQQSGEALLSVINDILDFSKVEAGKLNLDASDYDVCDTVEGIVDLLYNRAKQKSVGLIGSIDPDVSSIVHGDANRLRQVLMNLIGNAIKFTDDGQIVVQLSQRETAPGNSVLHFAVKDTGIGIAEGQRALIFDSFAQADVSTTREYGGTGLGLAISKQLVELMGGEIGVESTLGVGSTFWFTLPFVSGKDSSRIRSRVFEPLFGRRILIVDDNQTNREVFARQLSAWEVEIQTAASAFDAMNMLAASANRGEFYDLVLLDFCMPETNGIELASAIRSRPDFGRPGMLMLSSAGCEFETQRVDEAGIDLYLPKPIRRAALYEAVTQVLQEGRVSSEGDAVDESPLPFDEPRLDLTVLLVEDIPINMQVARHMLTSIGCRVVEATNGQEALDMIEEHRLDLVLMDCQMPIMDGYSATRKQRAREAGNGSNRIPIIALTANALAEDRQKCLDAGMDDFVSKPFSRNDLVNVLQRRVDGYDDSDASAASAPSETPDIVSGRNDEPAIDRAALDQIAELDPEQNGELLNSVIDTYVENAEALIVDLTRAAKHDDLGDAVRAAHSLKSSSANVGAVRLAKLCASMEKDGRGGDISTIVKNVDRVRAEYAIVIHELLEEKTGVAA